MDCWLNNNQQNLQAIKILLVELGGLGYCISLEVVALDLT